MEDVRSKKVAFLAYCLLDQNARAKGIAKYPGPVSEVVETLMENGVGLVQMPCPELIYEDFNRPPRPKNWYDHEEFRSTCRKCAQNVAEQVGKYVKNDYHVVSILGVENSPSCAVKILPVIEDRKRRWMRSKGIFIEELLKELGKRGLNNLPVIGIYIEERRMRSTCKKLEKAIAQA